MEKNEWGDPCLSDFSCFENAGRCVHDDDFEELRGLWMDSDAIIYSVPVYHMTYPGQLKCFIDRLGNSTSAFLAPDGPGEDEAEFAPKLLKAIGNIAQGIHIFSGQESTLTDLINHALIMQCIPVQGDPWESYIGAGGWTANAIERDALKRQSNESQDDACQVVTASIAMGRRVVETAMLIKSGLLAQKEKLATQDVYRPLYGFLEGRGWKG